jgi:hypothetical protein
VARNIRIDLGKLGQRLPAGLQRAGRAAGKAVEKPLTVAAAVTQPELIELPDAVDHPIVAGRLRRCTIECRAHLLGIADLPALEYQYGGITTFVLMRVRVERPDGDFETCVRQHLPTALRRLAPGSSLRALAHEEERRFVVMDWKTTAERLGIELAWPTSLDQYDWPGPEDWPALDAIEVRCDGRARRRLEKRRAEWQPARALLLDADTRGNRMDGRQKWTLELDLHGRRVTIEEGVPDLALAKLVGSKAGKERLGGLVTSTESVANEGAPLAVLVSPDGEVAVDWEATLNQPEMRATE